MSGCKKKPSPSSQFCPDHKKDTGPVVLSEQLSKETKNKLRKTRSLNYPQDNIFFVRTLMKHDKHSDKFLVRWAKFPDNAMTWEPRKALPAFVVSWYEQDQKRFGCDIPPGEGGGWLCWRLIQSTSCNVRLSVSLFMPLWITQFFVDWRLLVGELICPFWYRSYHLNTSRGSVSPLCVIFFFFKC